MEECCRAEKDDNIIAAYILGNAFYALARRIEDDPYDRVIHELEEKYRPIIENLLDAILETSNNMEKDKLLAQIILSLL